MAYDQSQPYDNRAAAPDTHTAQLRADAIPGPAPKQPSAKEQAWNDAMQASLKQPLGTNPDGSYTVKDGDCLSSIAMRSLHMSGKRATSHAVAEEVKRIKELNMEAHPKLGQSDTIGHGWKLNLGMDAQPAEAPSAPPRAPNHVEHPKTEIQRVKPIGNQMVPCDNDMDQSCQYRPVPVQPQARYAPQEQYTPQYAPPPEQFGQRPEYMEAPPPAPRYAEPQYDAGPQYYQPNPVEGVANLAGNVIGGIFGGLAEGFLFGGPRYYERPYYGYGPMYHHHHRWSRW